VNLLIPLYVYPLDDREAWTAATRLGSDATIIVNVHNGPGERYDPAYAYATAALASAGVPMLGYVDLDYAARTLEAVYADITAWRLYPVGGVFFDRVPSESDALSWTALATAPVRGRVALNPGTRPHPGYAALADVICTFEGPWTTYRRQPAEPDWPNAAHLVYGIPPDDLPAAQRRLERRVPTGLASELDVPEPYRGLPTGLRGTAAVR